MTTRKKTIFITGATAGFGKAIAYKFAQHGYDLILNGRRADRLRIIEKDLIEQFGCKVVCLPFDVRDKNKAAEEINGLSSSSVAVSGAEADKTTRSGPRMVIAAVCRLLLLSSSGISFQGFV